MIFILSLLFICTWCLCSIPGPFAGRWPATSLGAKTSATFCSVRSGVDIWAALISLSTCHCSERLLWSLLSLISVCKSVEFWEQRCLRGPKAFRFISSVEWWWPSFSIGIWFCGWLHILRARSTRRISTHVVLLTCQLALAHPVWIFSRWQGFLIFVFS